MAVIPAALILAEYFWKCGILSAFIAVYIKTVIEWADPAWRGTDMREEEQDYVYALFGDEESEKRLKDYVFYCGLRLALHEKWVINGSAIVERMSEIAVQEILHHRCKPCNGTGLDRKLRTCCHCSGVGVSRIPGRDISDMIGVDHSHFTQLWRRRYDCIYVVVQDIQGNLLSIIRRAENMEAILLA